METTGVADSASTADAMAGAIAFYAEVLNMQEIRLGSVRRYDGAVPRARSEQEIEADLCFTTKLPIADVIRQFQARGLEILKGPVCPAGDGGASLAVYLKDPYRNVVEVKSENDV